MTTLTDTKKEIAATKKTKVAVARFVTQRLTVPERAALGFAGDASGAHVLERVADEIVETLRTLAQSRIATKRNEAERRSPLVEARYAKTLANGISRALLGLTKVEGAQWASITRNALHSAYMLGSNLDMTTSSAHPGSRAGVLVVDLRKVEDFAGQDGVVTSASILARVRGEPKP